MCVQPLANEDRKGKGFASRISDMAGFNVAIRGGEFELFGGYAREGAFLSLASEIARTIQRGALPSLWL